MSPRVAEAYQEYIKENPTKAEAAFELFDSLMFKFKNSLEAL